MENPRLNAIKVGSEFTEKSSSVSPKPVRRVLRAPGTNGHLPVNFGHKWLSEIKFEHKFKTKFIAVQNSIEQDLFKSITTQRFFSASLTLVNNYYTDYTNKKKSLKFSLVP